MFVPEGMTEAEMSKAAAAEMDLTDDELAMIWAAPDFAEAMEEEPDWEALLAALVDDVNAEAE